MRRAQLTPVQIGVYAAGHPGKVRLGREVIALLATAPDAVLCAASVLVAHALISLDPGRAVDVTVCGRPRTLRHRPGVRFHRRRRPSRIDVHWVDGVPCTTVERALLDAAPELAERQLERTLDIALARHLTSRTKVRELLEREGWGHRGAPRLRALIDERRPQSRTESGPAERALTLIRTAGLPEPETEVSMGGYRADFLFRKAGVVFEVDSHTWHGVVKANFERDREKDRVYRREGLVVVSATADALEDRPLAVIADLAMTIAERMAARAAWSTPRITTGTRGAGQRAQRAAQARSAAGGSTAGAPKRVRTSGSTMLPSSCWPFSSRATIVREEVTAVPLSVWTSAGLPSAPR